MAGAEGLEPSTEIPASETGAVANFATPQKKEGQRDSDGTSPVVRGTPQHVDWELSDPVGGEGLEPPTLSV